MKLQNNDKKVIIIGAGPAGLTAAYDLCKSQIPCTLIEKDKIVGGLSRTVSYKDFYFDIGGHRFFTKIKVVDEMWRKVLEEDFLERDRLSRIYYNKKFFNYPLRILNALYGLGLWYSLLILLSYFKAQIFPERPEETLEQWVSNRFGKILYRKFFKTYTEKVWGVPCSEITAEWAAQRIKGLSVFTAVKHALIRQNSSKKSGVIKTLTETFHYPKRGPGMMWEAVADIVKKEGNELLLGAEVEKVRLKRGKVEGLQINVNGKKEFVKGTHFISSMPLGELIQKCEPAVPVEVLEGASSLKHRDFLTVALIVDKPDLFQDNWIYVHDPDVRVGRIQNYKNWSPHMVPRLDKTCLGLEYFCSEGDEIWTMSDPALIELGKTESEMLGLVDSSEVEDGVVVRMKKAYPVYDSTFRQSVQIITEFLGQIDNLQVVGRNGMHRYNNQDHSMLTAMLAVKNILGGEHDLWKVNEEQEYHEEVREEPFEEPTLERLFAGTFARLDKLGFAFALGSVSGFLVFLATIWLIIQWGEVVGPNMQLLSQYFYGYTVSVRGAFIGMFYSFCWAFLFGWLFAYLRNFFLALYIYRVKRRSELLTFRDFLDNF